MAIVVTFANHLVMPNTSDNEAPFLDLHLSISNGLVSSKIYYIRYDFDFDIVNFPFLDGDVPRRPSYGVYISHLMRFVSVCSHVDDSNARNNCLNAKLLKQDYQKGFFQVLSPTPLIGFKIQCRIIV